MTPEEKLLFQIVSNWGSTSVTHAQIMGWIDDFSKRKTETITGQLIADDLLQKRLLN